MSADTSYHARVLGPPAFAGNKRGFINKRTGRVIITERKGQEVRSWQDTLRAACAENAPPVPINGPVEVVISVSFARPAGHFGTGRNAHRLKESAPGWAAVKPDCDKIARAALDCLTGIWIVDDARVVSLSIQKWYVAGGKVPETWVYMRPRGEANKLDLDFETEAG